MSLRLQRKSRRSLFRFGESLEKQAHKDVGKAEFEAKPLIERNVIKLAILEREWAVLGPLRPITFKVKFENEDDARSFAASLPGKGFEVSFCHHLDDGGWSMEATCTMEPTATNVTHWEEWFEAQALALLHDNEDGVYYSRFEGWSYPERVAPAFSLEGGIWSQTGARKRTEILFGATLGLDLVSNGKYTWPYDNDYLAPPFRLVPSEFLRKARERRPATPEPTASNFAQWIYSLYADAFGNPQDREEGKAAEGHILAARRRAYTSIDNVVMRAKFPEWRLVHNGLHADQGNAPNFFTISDLIVGGEPLRALPDLIYRNQRTGEMIIVEIKHSRMVIPNNLWPNIWGQLWCYSQLEQARRAPKVTVIGEVWGDAWTIGREQMRLVCLRASVRRDPRASPYDRFFRSLFNIYRGVD